MLESTDLVQSDPKRPKTNNNDTDIPTGPRKTSISYSSSVPVLENITNKHSGIRPQDKHSGRPSAQFEERQEYRSRSPRSDKRSSHAGFRNNSNKSSVADRDNSREDHDQKDGQEQVVFRHDGGRKPNAAKPELPESLHQDADGGNEPAARPEPVSKPRSHIEELLSDFGFQVAKQVAAQLRRDSAKISYDQKAADFAKSRRYHEDFPSTLESQTRNLEKARNILEVAERELDDHSIKLKKTTESLVIQIQPSRMEVDPDTTRDLEIRLDSLQQKYDILEAKYHGQQQESHDTSRNDKGKKFASLEKELRDYQESSEKAQVDTLGRLKRRVDEWEARTREYREDFGKLKGSTLNDSRNNAKFKEGQLAETASIQSEIAQMKTEHQKLWENISYIKATTLGLLVNDGQIYSNDIADLKTRLDNVASQTREAMNLRIDLVVFAGEYDELTKILPEKWKALEALSAEVFGDSNRKSLFKFVQVLEDNEEKLRNGVRKLHDDIWGEDANAGRLELRLRALEDRPRSGISSERLSDGSIDLLRNEIIGLRDGQEAADNLTAGLIEKVIARTSSLESSSTELRKQLLHHLTRIDDISHDLSSWKHNVLDVGNGYNQLRLAVEDITRRQTALTENGVSMQQVKDMDARLVAWRQDFSNSLEHVNMGIRSLDHRYSNISTEPMCRQILGQVDNIYPHLRETNTQLGSFAITQLDIVRRLGNLEGKINEVKDGNLPLETIKQIDALKIEIKSISDNSRSLSDVMQTLQNDFEAAKKVLDKTQTSVLLNIPEVRAEVDDLKERVDGYEGQLKTKKPLNRANTASRNSPLPSTGTGVATSLRGVKKVLSKRRRSTAFVEDDSENDAIEDSIQ